MRLAWRLFRRDLAAGELTLLLAALILAIAATTTLRFFSSSLEEAIRQQAAQLIGADLVLSSSRSLRPEWSQEAATLGLSQTTLLEFVSMAQQGDSFQLSSVKAVSAGYPLRGELKVRGASGIPQPGTIWVEERLLNLLHTQPGQTVVIGDATFTITAIVDQDADRGGGFSALSPKILMNLADVPSTHIIQPGSRIAWRLLMAGKPEALATYQAWGKTRLLPDERLRDIQTSNQRLGSPIATAGSYLSLTAIVAVLLAGIAVALATRRYSERRRDSVALMRCLGASRRDLLSLFGQQLLIVWLIAMAVGGLIGLGAATGLFHILQGLLPVAKLEFVILTPLLTGMATATLTLLGFALPSFLELYQVSPLRVLRRELTPPRLSSLAMTGAALTALFVLMAVETGKLWLTGVVLGGGLVLAGTLGGLLHLALTRLRKRASTRHPVGQALAALSRQPGQTVAQVLALALGLTAMLLVGGLRSELLDRWQSELPKQAPNQFAITIPADQVEPLQQALAARHWTATDFYPIVRGRLVAINGKPVQKPAPNDKQDGDNRDNALDRELNLTWRDVLPPENTITAGQWLNGAANEVSVEEELAKRLKLGLGDTVRLQMAEGAVDARVTSLRKVNWDSFQPNFYLIFPRHLLAVYPASYLTSFYVPAADKLRISELVKAFPTIIFFDIGQLMDELQKLVAQLTQSARYVYEGGRNRLVLVLAGDE